eukprot:CAMPEP_0119143538 /NCGR_PEP_ID=MMETSP1310-20130426/34500_1 /TAXON_ID=464262 /ORGANISM="Genus nov. species nov., Strain RCC2339" /LENGTH=66 /DNA_ID=CAMNT_0007135175 /DNA_START=1 /DNA_END=198 /DNA_ORIENTATION=-
MCAPSRYTILAGRSQFRGTDPMGIWSLGRHQFEGGQLSIAQFFQNHGYNTGFWGKWHLGGEIQVKS